MTATPLRLLQQRLKDAVVGVSVPDAPQILREVRAAERIPLSAEARVSVYRVAYQIRMLEALTEDFPAVKRLVGPDAFSALITKYLERFPSCFASLAEVGARLPEFISAVAGFEGLPFLSEVARLEWQCVLSGLEPEGQLLDALALAELAPEQIGEAVLKLAPPVRLFESDWAVHRASNSVLPERMKSHIVIHRTAGDTVTSEVTCEEWTLLREIWRGRAIGELAGGMTEVPVDRIVVYFKDWAARGWFCGFERRPIAPFSEEA